MLMRRRPFGSGRGLAWALPWLGPWLGLESRGSAPDRPSRRRGGPPGAGPPEAPSPDRRGRRFPLKPEFSIYNSLKTGNTTRRDMNCGERAAFVSARRDLQGGPGAKSGRPRGL